MLQRVYSPRLLKRNTCYLGTSVDPDWLRFSTFKAWMVQQDWVGKVLDKDLLAPGNRTYGPANCLFVSQAVNTLLNRQPHQRGNLPLGVSRHGKRFKVTFKKLRKTRHLGVFDTAEEAAAAYGQAKAAWIEELMASERCPHTKHALLREANNYRRGTP